MDHGFIAAWYNQENAMKMIHFFALLIWVMSACNKPENLSEKPEQDSLKRILIAHQSLIRSVNEANLILDSLDQYTNLSTEVKKTGQESISSRLQKVSSYVKASEARIAKVESALKKSRKEASANFLMMDALKDEVRIRDKELQVLSDSIARSNAVFSAASLTKMQKPKN